MIERLEIVGADSCGCPYERQSNHDYRRGTPMCVPSIMNINKTLDTQPKGQTHCIKGQTHGSAPTYKYNRRSLRLPHYDYSRAGYYFITIATQNREHLFGEIVGGKMVLSVAGDMVGEWYGKLEEKFANVTNHDMVIMPNHIHFIIEIMDENKPVGADPCVRPHERQSNYEFRRGTPMCVPSNMNKNKILYTQSKGQTHEFKGQTHGSAPTGINGITVGDVVQWFKTMTTNQYIKMVKNNTLPPFDKRIWQRNFYEHVIRDEKDYARISEYIQNNETTWELDILNKP